MLMMASNQEDQYMRLLGASRERLIDQYIARLVIAPRESVGALPLHIGLGEQRFLNFFERRFPGMQTWFSESFCPDVTDIERSLLRDELFRMREDEIAELIELLEAHRNPLFDEEISVIMATGCMGGDHLWRDLGFPDRSWLSDFIQLVYPDLKAMNNKDMKWKRFLYKQLCESGGNYVCRAPSCEQCTAYDECFGPEE